jgi:hypothetical protein
VIASGLLCGCATSLQGSSIGPSVINQIQTVDRAGVPTIRQGPIGFLRLRQLEMAGKIPPALERRILERMGGRSRLHVTFDGHAVVGLWAIVASAYTYIFGENAKGNKTVTAIDVQSNGCIGPSNLKVDHAENLWLACGTSPSDAGVIQAYAPGSKEPAATFTDSFTCGAGCYFDANANDVATDSSGHVFAANPFSETCDPSCTDWTYPLVWWNAKSASSPATGIAEPDMTNGDYIDVDPSGNLYAEGYGCIESQCGAILDEISDPTTASAKITHLIAPYTGSSVGAIYVSNKGQVLNLVDSGSRTMLQYALPWVPHELPFNVLGPTPTNYYGGGYPIAGGFDRADKLAVLGDAYGWLDIGKVAKNRWSAVTNVNLFPGVLGAAYVPSDK